MFVIALIFEGPHFSFLRSGTPPLYRKGPFFSGMNEVANTCVWHRVLITHGWASPPPIYMRGPAPPGYFHAWVSPSGFVPFIHIISRGRERLRWRTWRAWAGKKAMSWRNCQAILEGYAGFPYGGTRKPREPGAGAFPVDVTTAGPVVTGAGNRARDDTHEPGELLTVSRKPDQARKRETIFR